MVDLQAKISLKLDQTSFKISFFNVKPSIHNISWINGKLHGITLLEINYLRLKHLLLNINQLFETYE